VIAGSATHVGATNIEIDRLSHMSTPIQDLNTFVKAMVESGFDNCASVAKAHFFPTRTADAVFRQP
jgi:hypothetical protein